MTPPDSVIASETPEADVAEAEDIEARLREFMATIRRGPNRPQQEQSQVAYISPPVEVDDSPPVEVDDLPNGAKFGDRLVARGLITDDDLQLALASQGGKRVGEALVEMGVITGPAMAQALAEHLGLPFVDLQERPATRALASMVPEEVARRYRALPIDRKGDRIVVAMAAPNDVFALDDLRVLAGTSIEPVVADADALAELIDRAYQHSEIESDLDSAAGATVDTPEEDMFGDDVNATDGPVVRLVTALLEQAITERASDIHVEPSSKGLKIRMRVDGILHDTFDAPLNTLRPLVSRLKVMGNVDIAQSRLPQDGRFSLTMGGRVVDVRMATLPTAAGEAVVLRLLDPDRVALSMDTLGLTEVEAHRFLPACRASQGAVFITGPTGSGKSTTLYAVASAVNHRDKSIISVEDPVEFRIDGIKQMQINTRAGATFAGALRSTLRADPDIIVVGEVRDAETARIAADASITGHLVFSTLHTTRAAATPIRLIDMGVEPYLVASALSCIVAQRLVRKPCSHCAVEMDADVDLLRDLGATDEMLAETPTVKSGAGCAACMRTGYRGRAALFEIMPVTEEIAHLIATRAPSAEIERVAVEQGMDTLRAAAMRRVLRGQLSVDEMLRAIS